MTRKKTARPTVHRSPGEVDVASAETVVTDFPVVGVGASAGGLQAYKRFLSALPPDSALALVLIPHLDPTHESLMAELLGRYTDLPVREAEQDMDLEPGRVYIIPPNSYMTLRSGRLHLAQPSEPRGMQMALDTFFRSLAEAQGERAIGIILSGTGSHGSVGLKEIKLAGGMVMAQQPDTADYDQMPQNAIATGLVDFVLSPEAMPRTLLSYIQHPYVKALAAPSPAVDGLTDDLNRVLAVLRSRTKYDFRAYRKNMLMRRIQRRMGLRQVEELDRYIDLLRVEPDEVGALYKDLLIGVTSFFREPEAFQVLAQRVLPELVESVGVDAPVRVWVPGCATGEEAYTLAILVFEAFRASDKPTNLQLFATDIDEAALEAARQGVFSDSIVAEVSQEYLRRYFVKLDEHSFQVNKQLRESVVFASQNLISDAPFSRLDLVSCRNLLIYLEPAIQHKVISLFHFALREQGFLLLGPSESIGRQSMLFETFSKKWRVFRSRGPVRHDLVDIPIVASPARSLQPARVGRDASPQVRYAELSERRLLAVYAPAAVLIDSRFQVLYFHGPSVDYLEFPTGEPSRDLMSMLRQGLRTKLRAAVHKAQRGGEEVIDAAARVRRNGRYVPCQIRVMPIQEPREAQGLLLVSFVDRDVEPAAVGPLAEAGEESSLVSQLEQELKVSRQDLQASVEEMESSNEELKASNEEVMSMNEELQSANEELETSKEELQSLNEELSTVNNQLSDKVDELERANNDMVNLFHSTEIATVFLDTELRIQRFTPAIGRLLSLIASDTGRPISNFAPNFSDDSLLLDAKRVLEQLSPVDKEVRSVDGRYYLRRILPYRTVDNHIEGVVVTFTDITERFRHEAEVRELNETLEERVETQTRILRESDERTRSILETTPDAIITVNSDGVIEDFNQGAERIFGYAGSEVIGQKVGLLLPERLRGRYREFLERYLARDAGGLPDGDREIPMRRKDGSIFPAELSVSEIDHLHRFTGILRDVSGRKALQRALLDTADEEQRRLGQEMHDGTQQELVGLGLLARNLVDDLNAEAPEHAGTARRLAEGLRETLENVRGLARDLIPQDVRDRGLKTALALLTERVDRHFEVTCRLVSSAQVDLQDAFASTHLYRIAQEAITNAVKHSGASEIVVTLAREDERFSVEVCDNGSGIPTERQEGGGMGLRIMSYRADLLGAHLEITPLGTGGTRVRCSYFCNMDKAVD